MQDLLTEHFIDERSVWTICEVKNGKVDLLRFPSLIPAHKLTAVCMLHTDFKQSLM